MRLTRLYIPALSFTAGQTVALNDDQSHYMVRVLRYEEGHPIVVFNETSGAWQGSLVVKAKRGSVVLEKQIQTPMPPSDIWLVMSPIKKEAWDFALEKATELGVAAIQPVLMDYTQNARVNDERAKANLIEASQQCERTHVPDFFKVEKLETLLRNWDASRMLYVALERSDAQPALSVFDRSHPGAILVGPEGGFSQREKELFMKYEFIKPINLGKLILRAETASLAALSLWASQNK
jgi:16S rRNA (uracil1498-N3)-methyltransferase